MRNVSLMNPMILGSKLTLILNCANSQLKATKIEKI